MRLPSNNAVYQSKQALKYGLQKSFIDRAQAVFYGRIGLCTLYLWLFTLSSINNNTDFPSSKLDLAVIIFAYSSACLCYKLRGHKKLGRWLHFTTLIFDLFIHIFLLRSSGFIFSPLMAVHPFLTASFILLFHNPLMIIAPLITLPIASAFTAINVPDVSVLYIFSTLLLFCILDVLTIFFIHLTHSKEQNLLHKLYSVEKKLRELAIIKERQRIAREFHDGVGAHLTSIVMQCDFIEMSRQNDSDLASELSEVKLCAIESIDDMRRSIAFLNRQFDLCEQLEIICQNFRDRHHLNLKLSGTKNLLDITLEAQVTCCRIVQESLTNVLKHANASKIQVYGQSVGTKKTLIIEDNGQGFDCPLNKQNHFGLNNMVERAKLIGATLTIKSQKNLGTKIELTFMRKLSN